ncbi:SDR family NAD(P)-dependent oxidoreductase [Cellulomonas sp. NPDC057328]|uniref:SDR family NAD(P)-dependent oxidoreductase n=1 Tax=Cellulomonas sp. NPDC057328 TaxID=3346101 RepID=UPI0036334CB3
MTPAPPHDDAVGGGAGAARPAGGVMVVTGGGRGIGAAIARRAVADGYGVLLTYAHDDASASALVAGLRGSGGRAVALRADARDPATPAAALDRAEAELGPVTVVVNNAGVTGRIGPFGDVTPDDVRRVLDVNVLGTLLLSQEAVRRWLAAGATGAVVNVSSVAATLGAPGEYVPYAASKAAVEAMTVGLAREVAGRGIRVNAVSPGTVDTEIHAAAGEPGRPARVAGRIPMGRVGTVDEIAAAVLWLASAEASYVTGAVLRVSGGL